MMSRRKTRFNRWTVPMLNRALELREAGLTYPAIAAVLNLDFGTTVSGETTRRYLRDRCGCPPDTRRGRPYRSAA